MNKTLYITDLDGTFLTAGSKLSHNTKDKLIKLLDDGLLFTVSTLRSIESIKHIFDGVNLNLPIITRNGALLIDFKTKKKLDLTDIPSSIKNELIKNIETIGSAPVILTYNEKEITYFKEDVNEGTAWFYNSSRFVYGQAVEKYTNIDAIIDEEWIGITVIDKLEQLQKLRYVLEDKFKSDLNVNITESIETPDHHWLTINSIKASKSNGIKYLKEVCGYEDHKIVSFGDQPVDIAMFEVSDLSVAVENAHEDVLNRADLIIGHHENDSVIEYIENDFKIKV